MFERTMQRGFLPIAALLLSLFLLSPSIKAESVDQTIHLKYSSFDPLQGEPVVPLELRAALDNDLHLVQFTGPIQGTWYGRLEEAGAEVLAYIPQNTFLARIPAGSLDTVRRLGEVTWVGPFHPAYKIEEGLLSATGKRIDVSVLYLPGEDRKQTVRRIKETALSRGGAVIKEHRLFPLLQFSIPPASLPPLAGLPEVRWIERLHPAVLAMNKTRQATGSIVAAVGGFDGSGVVGEVKEDDGIDPTHPDFGNLIGTEGDPGIGSGHGCCTFGILFGDGTNDPTATGMLPGGSGIFCTLALTRMESIENLHTVWDGVLQSNSWGGGNLSGIYSVESQEDDQAVADYDVAVFYAAGNSGNQPSRILADAVAKNVIGVGAVAHWDTLTRADDVWGNYFGPGATPGQGPAADGRFKPDLCGFCDNIYTTYLDHGYYYWFGGTSAATPIVAGAAGQVYQMYRENHFGNTPSPITPHAATVKALLIANAWQYPLSVANRFQQGWGLPDVDRIYDVGENHLIVDGGNPLATGEHWQDTLLLEGGAGPLKISLVWTDVPGEPAAAMALVNDLDLRVIAPDGTVYRGNQGLANNHWSSSGGSWDRLNNVENVFVQSPTAGTWTFRVLAHNVALDNDQAPGVNQAFSLAVTFGGGDAEVERYILTGPGPARNNPPLVRIWNPADTDDYIDEWLAYGVHHFGVNVDFGLIRRGGEGLVVTAPGPGPQFGPHVRFWTIEGDRFTDPPMDFLAYGTNRYGANVATGDIYTDTYDYMSGFDEVITGAGPGAVFGPHVRGWRRTASGHMAPVDGVSFFAYGTPKWGVNVACGDIDGDGFDEIITGPGPGAVYGPHVRGWKYDDFPASTDPIPAVSFFAYGTHRFGARVACGDLDGDGFDEIITSPGPGEMFGPHVRGWNYDGDVITPIPGVSFFAYQGGLYGAHVAAVDLDGDGVDEILTMPGPDPAVCAQVKGFNVDGGGATLINGIDYDACADLGLMSGGRVAGAVMIDRQDR